MTEVTIVKDKNANCPICIKNNVGSSTYSLNAAKELSKKLIKAIKEYEDYYYEKT